MKKPQHISFKFSPIATAVAIAITSQFIGNIASAGTGFGSGLNLANSPVAVPTYYANSPSGPIPFYDANGVQQIRTDGSALPVTAPSGTLLRKFVDTLPGFGAANANNSGLYIPVATPEKWIDPNGVTTADDYYEIAAVEFTQKMHSDLPKATRLRGYVQIATPRAIAAAKAANASYAGPFPFTVQDGSATGKVISVVDLPHHLGPVSTATKGTTVRVKFTNYLPVGGKIFLPYDETLAGAGTSAAVDASGKPMKYTQNRAGMHLVGGQAPWISAGSPHQWIAPAGETAAYAAGIGKGASAQSAPDMLDPGNGSVNLVFPNDMSARFTFIQDRTSGMTRLNAYAGLESAYMITDPVEQGLISSGVIPAAQIPLIIEDKTFVPANVAQQDALWDTTNWGTTGDLWFPHVYEPNQNPGQASGANPVGRWDYGPLFWPIFPVHPLKATLPSPSFVPEAYLDTPVINGVAYPTTTVEPKAYRMRILNASNDRYINLGLYVAAPDFVPGTTTPIAPQLDANGNPIISLNGTPQYLSGTEVKMVPAAPIDTLGSPPGWDAVNGVQLPLPQFSGATDAAGNPLLPWNINAEPSGPTRAWPVDGRAGGVPDPTTSGPDFVVIGNDGGLLPHAVDIPPQPVTYEQNRRSITVTNIYGYGLLLGPSERADTIVDFSAYAGKTLILYNDAPAPTPFNDQRNDYYTGNPDLSGQGGAYSTLPGYGPNTRTMMQIKVGSAVTSGGPLDAVKLAAALPAAYGASQPAPIVPEVAYNAAFNTTDTDNYARVATGSAAQAYLTVNHSANGGVTLGCPIPAPAGCQDFTLVTSSGAGSGSGSGYATAPTVVLTNAPGDTTGTGATATATLNAAGQVSSVKLTNRGFGYKAAPIVTFVPNNSVSGITVANGGSGFTAPVTVTLSGGGLLKPTNVAATVALSIAGVSTGLTAATGAPVITTGGSGYLVPPTVGISQPTGTVTSGKPVTATGVATIATSPVFVGAGTVTAQGTGYTSATPTVVLSAPQNAGTTATATASVGFAVSPTFTITAAGSALDAATTAVSLSAPDLAGGTQAQATATVNAAGAITAITLSATNPGTGYSKAPTVSITDKNGNTTAAATAALAAGSGKVFGLTVTNGGTGYSAAPTVTITDTTGKGALANVSLDRAAGYVNGLTITNGGSGYTSVPTVTFTDATTKAVHTGAANAVASVSLSTAPGAILSVSGVSMPSAASFVGGVAGFTSAPTVTFKGGPGGGASATVGIAPVGVGAQATITTSTTASFPVLTKAEQELFDDFGRYNSTGGVELPFTTASVQTTIPLNYMDQPTEILGENEAQVWKLVDNGLWTNSIHFSGWDVQLINRVGWDGTVKAPATNEVGWKDTIRLNPLEDAVVAMRATTPKVAFGQPQSTRLLDPSKPAGTGNFPTAPAMPVAGTQYVQGLGFTADPNVVTQANTMNSATVGVGTVLLPTSTNTASLAGSTTGNFDNEFLWGSAILGHSEDDLTRPVVFNAAVTKPRSPSVLADTAGNGTLTWTDPTPAATSKGNPRNEIGFKIQQAPLTLANYSTGAFTTLATVPANVVNYQEPAALVSPTPPNGQFYAYQVVAYNAAGESAPSNVWYEAPPAAPSQLRETSSPMATLNSSTFADVQAALTWNDNSNNESGFTITRTGGVGATLNNGVLVPAAGAPAFTFTAPAGITSVNDPQGLVEGAYYQYAVNATNSFGNSAAAQLINPIQAPVYQVPAQITGLKVTGTTFPYTLSWNVPTLNNWTRYTLTRTSSTGATNNTNSGTTASAQVTALNTGSNYSYTVSAGNAIGNSTPSASVTIYMPPNASTNTRSVAGAVGADTITVSWSNNSNNLLGTSAAAFTVQRQVVALGGTPSPTGWTTITPTITPTNTAQGATSYAFTDNSTGGLAVGTGYVYQVTANAIGGGNSAFVTNRTVAR